MKIRNLFLLSALCCALAFTLGACNEETQDREKMKALRKAADEAGLILSVDATSVIGVKDKNISSYVIPDGITSIERRTFSGKTAITSVTIPESVTSIGDGAFAGCSSLSITIPESVTGIGKEAFDEIKTVSFSPVFETLPDGTLINKKYNALVSAPENIFGAGYMIPESVKHIGGYAFSSCFSLTSITIPESIVSIGKGAFFGCTSLTSITIPKGVTSIGDGAFAGVKSVRVSTGNSVFSMDSSGVLINKEEKKLLYGPISLSTYTIPKSITSIGQCAFSVCSKLTSITIPNSVTSIGDGAFAGCTSLTRITIPQNITSIGSGTFLACKKLPGITIPEGVTSIGSNAFAGCSSLRSVTIPEGVTSIGSNAFAGCSSLRSVTIPDSVTSVGDLPFLTCYALMSITVPNHFTDEEVKAWFFDFPYDCQIIRK